MKMVIIKVMSATGLEKVGVLTAFNCACWRFAYQAYGKGVQAG